MGSATVPLRPSPPSAEQYRTLTAVQNPRPALLVVADPGLRPPAMAGRTLEFPVSGRDLLLAVDLSGSMETPDFAIGGKQVDRLTALKQLAYPFIERRTGDRIGLILFGDQAYVQTPLTFDLNSVTTLLSEALIGLAGQADRHR